MISGVTTQGYVNGPIIYGFKNTDTMENGGSSISMGNDKFSVCNNFQIEKGHDIAYLDVKNYHQVIVLGAQVAKFLFGFANPIGQTVTVSGQPFTVIGVYQSKDANSEYSMDNMAVVPESANRLLNQNQTITSYVVKAKNASATKTAMAGLRGALFW